MTQFPNARRRPVRGTYDSIPSSARGEWNARDTASVGATMTIMQAAIVPTSYMLDSVASTMMPKVPAVVPFDIGFWAILFGQTLLVGAIKGISNLMRHHGSSLMKDLFAWLSLVLGDLIRASLVSAAFDWLPWRRRRRFPNVRPDVRPRPRPDVRPNKPTVGPIRRWFRNRPRLF